MFAELEAGFAGTDLVTGRHRGLKTAIATVRQWRRDPRAGEDTDQGGIDRAWVSNGGNRPPEPVHLVESIVRRRRFTGR